MPALRRVYFMLDEMQKNFVGYMMPLLPEKTRRLFLGGLATLWGRGSLQDLHELTKMAKSTIIKGQKQLTEQKMNPEEKNFSDKEARQRKKGGGRKSSEIKYPRLKEELSQLLDGSTVGNPESTLCWTTKSLRHLSKALETRGITVCFRTIKTVLESMGFSLQQNRKYIEGGDPGPDRDEQFRFIQKQSELFLSEHEPVISVDAKKKEPIGNFKNSGSEYRPEKTPVLVNDHDFADLKAAPYGIYDIGNNEGFVNVGISADTAEFAVNSIRSWWQTMGMQRYPNATRLMITADGGGSNGRRNRLWKKSLQDFANESGLQIHVSHFPPGTSKWNKIEHKMFCFITKNWRGKPLESLEIIINLIAATTTKTGLRIQCTADYGTYEKGIKVSDEEMESLNISREDWHGEWNYILKPFDKS